jgi:phosphate transport system protein
MREAYHEQLEGFQARIGRLAELTELALSEATRALLEGDGKLAAKVTEEEEFITRQHHQLDQDAVTLLALQQPVARDLRVVVAGLRMSADLDRMGMLARHVADIARHRTPDTLPELTRVTLDAMATVALRMAAVARTAIALEDPEAAAKLTAEDDEMDRLQVLLDEQTRQAGAATEITMDLALLGRFLERFADHTVSLARRVSFITGPV